ncbi:hypothetical protein [Winogradskyella sp. ECml5-4]|uniref:hypothetical protein n=1 Tax=Flavobacteriaceae TaxID=49546 RepID=UPI002FEFB2D6
MKKILLLVFVISSLTFNSCSSDDNSSNGSEYPKTVNIKFEVIASRNSEAIINRTINNDTQIDNADNLPYTFSYTQTEVNNGTYLKMTYLENGNYTATTGGGTSWTDYTAELNIYVDNLIVKTQTFNITASDFGVKEIDYTFE